MNFKFSILNSKFPERMVSISVFIILLATYWLTAPPTVSYWDCPEYVMGAWRLEIGHPPGNPFWMLVERVVTMLAPSGTYAALLVNLSSGLFTALAGMLLAKVIYASSGWIVEALSRRRFSILGRCVAAAVGGLAFGWSDSAWYSAVEAEVYAMSIFMTALCVWIMMKWAFCKDPMQSTRYLILLAYIFGLSIGVHQLNLLCIPALAMIWAIKRKVRRPLNLILLFFLSLAAVGCILVGVMPSTISLAAQFELLFTNTLHLPYLSGVAAYVALLALSLLLALVATARSHNRGLLAAALLPAIFLSGIFIFSENFAVGAALSAIVALLLVRGHDFHPRRLNICMWLLAMLLCGYSSYALIPIRGDIPFPSNSGLPGDPFSFATYQAREQYGGAPLLYGYTPLSKPMLIEEFDDVHSTPVYRRIAMTSRHPQIVKKMKDAKISNPYLLLDSSDSLLNAKAVEYEGDAYVVKGHRVEPIYTPELNMWFPRITSRDPADLACFADWAGMTSDNMVEVRTTEALDSAGNFVGRLGTDGKRHLAHSKRPTYGQSFRMLLSYQLGFMYFRYLLWNFSGRQNDRHSTGEVEHGNFITGISPIDNAMLGAEDKLPARLGEENPGRNRYFMLPLLLGIFGIFRLAAMGKRGRKTDIAIGMLFIMTGMAIVVYLNQSPGEPRERDYSFLGSYWAFALWIGFGTLGLMRSAGKYAPLTAILPLFTVGLMFEQNLDDHNRSRRRVASDVARLTLESLDRDAIIFVDGDNGTFPLWYAQEVEGVRKDVRVVNLAYLASPRYAAMLQRPWEGSRGVPSSLRPEEIAFDALLFPHISSSASNKPAAAHEALRRMAESPNADFADSRVILPIGKDTIIFPLQRLSKNGWSNTLEFRRLMMFDIIASNAEASNPRPIYFQSNISPARLILPDSMLSQALYSYRLGRLDYQHRKREYLRGLDISGNYLDSIHQYPLKSPDGYMDAVPVSNQSMLRAGRLKAALDMARNGDIEVAAEILEQDKQFGIDPGLMLPVKDQGKVFALRAERAKALHEIADSLRKRGIGKDLEIVGRMEKEALLLEQFDIKLRAEKRRYRDALPPYLRSKTAN